MCIKYLVQNRCSLNCSLIIVLASYCCHNKLLQTKWPKTTQIHCGGQKTKRNLVELTLKCEQGRTPSGGSKGKPISLPLPASRGCLRSWLTASSSIFEVSSVIYSSLSLFLTTASLGTFPSLTLICLPSS